MTLYNATPKGKLISAARTWWLRMNNDGTNWTFSMSHNGADWLSFYSESLTAFLGSTITDLGVYGDNHDVSSTGLSSMISIWKFRARWRVRHKLIVAVTISPAADKQPNHSHGSLGVSKSDHATDL